MSRGHTGEIAVTIASSRAGTEPDVGTEPLGGSELDAGTVLGVGTELAAGSKVPVSRSHAARTSSVQSLTVACTRALNVRTATRAARHNDRARLDAAPSSSARATRSPG